MTFARLTLIASCLLLTAAAPAEQEKAGTTAEEFAKQAQGTQRIEQYLSGLTTILADFSQVAPDGSITTGKFYLMRPGKMRWQYHPPTPLLIVSDGKVLTYFDYELEQVSKIPLQSSLISFLTREKISFTDAVAVEEFEEKDGAVRVTLVQSEKPTDGKLLLEFSDDPLALRNMVVTDATGQVTNVSLQNAKFGVALDKELFVFRDPRQPKRRL